MCPHEKRRDSDLGHSYSRVSDASWLHSAWVLAAILPACLGACTFDYKEEKNVFVIEADCGSPVGTAANPYRLSPGDSSAVCLTGSLEDIFIHVELTADQPGTYTYTFPRSVYVPELKSTELIGARDCWSAASPNELRSCRVGFLNPSETQAVRFWNMYLPVTVSLSFALETAYDLGPITASYTNPLTYGTAGTADLDMTVKQTGFEFRIYNIQTEPLYWCQAFVTQGATGRYLTSSESADFPLMYDYLNTVWVGFSGCGNLNPGDDVMARVYMTSRMGLDPSQSFQFWLDPDTGFNLP